MEDLEAQAVQMAQEAKAATGVILYWDMVVMEEMGEMDLTEEAKVVAEVGGLWVMEEAEEMARANKRK